MISGAKTGDIVYEKKTNKQTKQKDKKYGFFKSSEDIVLTFDT